MSFMLKNELDNISRLSDQVFQLMNLSKNDQEKSFMSLIYFLED